MKRLVKISLITATLLFSSFFAFAEEHHYGFILTCGRTEYIVSSVPLSNDIVLEILEAMEETYCGPDTEDHGDEGIGGGN